MAPDTRDLLTVEEKLSGAIPRTGRYAATVRVARLALGFLVFAVVAAILLWPELERTAPPDIKDTGQTISKNELIKPSFESMDSDAQPFSLNADRAVQDTDNPDRIDLEGPFADIKLKDGTVLKLKSARGVYQQDLRIMDLSGDVVMTTTDGYEMHGDQATINMQTQEIQTTTPVTGSGPFGTISGRSLSGNGAQGVMIFHGPATLILNEGITP